MSATQIICVFLLNIVDAVLKRFFCTTGRHHQILQTFDVWTTGLSSVRGAWGSNSFSFFLALLDIFLPIQNREGFFMKEFYDVSDGKNSLV